MSTNLNKAEARLEEYKEKMREYEIKIEQLEDQSSKESIA